MINKSLLCALATGLFVLPWQFAAGDENYTIRPSCNPAPKCYIVPGTYGYNDTTWRQWPTQLRVNQKDPRAIGASRIPTPPGTPEVQLPPGGTVPARPPITSGGTGSILPPTTGGTSSGTLTAPSPGGVPGVPGMSIPGLTPEFTPPGNGTGPSTPKQPSSPDLTPPNVMPSTPGTDLLPPSSLLTPGPSSLTPGPNPLTPGPSTPAPAPSPSEPAKKPDEDKPAPQPNPVIAPVPAPSNPGDLSPLKPGAMLPRNHGPEASLRADWNSSLRGDGTSDRDLRATNFEQRGAEQATSMRTAMDGFCPVELRDNEHWIAGRSKFSISYQGQVYHFSNEAAMKRFAAAPEKYAPAHGGNDPVLVVEEDRRVPGTIQHSAVWKGQLYLFASSANLAAFREDPTRYAARTASTPDAVSRPQQLSMPADSL